MQKLSCVNKNLKILQNSLRFSFVWSCAEPAPGKPLTLILEKTRRASDSDREEEEEENSHEEMALMSSIPTNPDSEP